jgi:hypothetical protein
MLSKALQDRVSAAGGADMRALVLQQQMPLSRHI